ncbi:Ank_4 domain-containing protein/PGG domain-containing protein [Cephalotus follicularis]|uniref:Ank_4 domain-containing protein/PGG domain-containing protein n=1 Tax=Cephalotus follicularis TaxID=3775 RepID=A0A1Q3B0D4_CEPFO|nr:Ank_4 domain-containing protein/PGG domain-containing protein [Cephalotus follicularis]
MTDRFTRTKEPYKLAMEENWEALRAYYESDERSFDQMLPMTLSKDTAFHMAVYSGRKSPLEELLDNTDFVHAYMICNAYGNTVLHEAAITGNLEAVKLLIDLRPEMLKLTNNEGETPLFKAAAYGEKEIVKYLVDLPYYRVVEDYFGMSSSDDTSSDLQGKHHMPDIHRTRLDGTSILHAAVQGEHFDTALELLKIDESLGSLEDGNGMTCLQMLSHMSSAFKSGCPMDIRDSIYYCLPTYKVDEGSRRASLTHFHRFIDHFIRWLSRGLGRIKKVRNDKTKHEYALKLAKKLIEKDMSWIQELNVAHDSSRYYRGAGEEEEEEEEKEENNGREKRRRDFESKVVKLLKNIALQFDPKSSQGRGEIQSQEEGEGQSPTSPQGPVVEMGEKKDSKAETPLLLATRHGISEIVKAILQIYPQAVEHCNFKGQNILHVAVKHRRKDIFDTVKKMGIPTFRLSRDIDADGYTILHHAATHDSRGNLRPVPALQLQAELQWFKRAGKRIPSHYVRHVDKRGWTAQKLFEKNHGDQLKQAQRWTKETSQSCSTVAVLVSTVVFAAAYTVPGGTDDKSGLPILLHKSFFLIFTVMDVISLACSLTSVVMFLSILTSPFEYSDFLHSLPRKLTIGFTLLFFSVTTTMFAFASTLVLTVKFGHGRRQWTMILIYVAAFFPVTVFALMQFPLYASFLAISFRKIKKSAAILSTLLNVRKPIRAAILGTSRNIRKVISRPFSRSTSTNWV